MYSPQFWKTGGNGRTARGALDVSITSKRKRKGVNVKTKKSLPLLTQLLIR